MVLYIYKINPSPPARAVMMVVDALGMTDYEYVETRIFSQDHLKEDYVKMNPQHTVPMIRDSSDGFVVWDSHAITTYLVGKYGKTDELYPTDLKKRAIVDQRLHFDGGVLFPAISEPKKSILLGGETSIKPEYLAKIASAYDFMEKFLTSTWLAGEQYTLADICCVASVSSLDRLVPIDEKLYPKLVSWWNRCAAKDFYKRQNVPGLEQFGGIIKSKVTSENQ